MADLVVHSADLGEGMRLFRAFEAGDIAAVKQVREMFGPDDACFLCDAECGADFRLFVTEDPKRARTHALLAPLCGNCMGLPMLQRLNRVRKMLAAMFPTIRRHDVNLTPAAPLRRLRG